jgi:hypothetical protein
MNLKELKELIEMLKDTDISELEIERSGVKVRLRRGCHVSSRHAAWSISSGYRCPRIRRRRCQEKQEPVRQLR